MHKPSIEFRKKLAIKIRRHIVTMSGNANASHVGSALSSVEILVALYFGHMNINPGKPKMRNRDRFILSKGHGGAALYAVLAVRGLMSERKLKQFGQNNGRLITHPELHTVPGVEATTGSLGHGLSIGLGYAIAGLHDKLSYRVFVLLSDGECDEGSNWEALLYAGAKKIHNLIVFVDYNKIQSFGRTKNVLDLEPLGKKFDAFGLCVREVDGHDFHSIDRALAHAQKHRTKPHAIIAHTVKGKGVSFMEDKLEWHYRSPTEELLNKALEELQ